MSQYHTDELGLGDLLETSQDIFKMSREELEASLLETDPGQELVEFVNNGTSVTENVESENSVTSNEPSSPEEFHGFTTPTKEMDKI